LTVFIDTGIFVAYFNKKDENHERALVIMKEVVEVKYGLVFTSDYVFDETVTTILSRTKEVSYAIKAGVFILGEIKGIPKFINLIRINNKLFDMTWESFKKEKFKKRLSFTDHSSIITIKHYNIDYIASFDSDFDGIVSRLY
jgi:predicted nucleic acid-binding protein